MSYVRVSILGVTNGGEKWSINPVFDPSFEFGDTVNQGNLDAAAAAIAALNPGSNVLGTISTQMAIQGARLEVRHSETDDLIGLSIANRSTPLYGNVAPRMGFQNAIVVSVRTNTPGGRGRGRIYWPCPAVTLGVDTRIPSATVTSFLADMKTYLLAMRSALATSFPTIGFDLAVRSTVSATTPHAVRIQVGDVVDTQRRRRDTLPETYATLTFP